MADLRSAVTAQSWEVDQFIAELAHAGTRAEPVAPFDEQSMSFCAALSTALLRSPQARSWPQLTALGFWLRPASIARIRDAFLAAAAPRAVVVPRGVVLHITPGNVDTMFVYSWAISLLTGNVSVVRVSDRAAASTAYLLSVVGELLARDEFAEVRRRSHLVHTAHDDRVSAALSAMADVRVIWGGDATVAHFRSFPLPPRGRDVTFPDRHSLAILDPEAVCRASEDDLAAIGESFFNDAYWFDQGGCSSPRLVLWAGGHDVARARVRLRAAVSSAVERRGYQADVGTVIEKMVRGLRAAAIEDGVRICADSNEATWVELPDLGRYDRDSCGGGIFFDVMSADLFGDLRRFVDSRDQTAACFGLDSDTVLELAHRLSGRGIDRFVRLGRALEFDALWDGYDLLQEFVKRVVVDV